jgi:hypothetical protein
MNRRIPRLLGALALALSWNAAVMAGPTLAALPNITTTATQPSPATPSNSAVVFFEVSATNHGPSNVSQLFLFAQTNGTVYSATSSQGSCTTSGALSCTFGALNAGNTVTVDVAFNTPSSGSSMPLSFFWNTTGTPPGKNRSHGDNFVDTRDMTLNGSGDFRSTYVFDSTLAIVSDNSSINNGNKQSTLVVSPGTGLPLTVQDGSFNISCGSADIAPADCPTSFFGETSSLDVNGGAVYGTPFKVVLQLYRPGVNPNQVHGIYHSWTDTTVDPPVNHDEVITAPCPATGTPTSQCFTATRLGSQNLQIVLWLFHNGKINGW